MMPNTQIPLVLKLGMGSGVPSNLTICFLGEERNSFTLLLSIFTNTGKLILQMKNVSYKKTLNLMLNGELL